MEREGEKGAFVPAEVTTEKEEEISDLGAIDMEDGTEGYPSKNFDLNPHGMRTKRVSELWKEPHTIEEDRIFQHMQSKFINFSEIFYVCLPNTLFHCNIRDKGRY